MNPRQRPPSRVSAASAPRWAVLSWAAMAVVFALAGWFFMLKPVSIAVGNALLARDYQRVPGEVVMHTGRDAEGAFTWYSARYTVAGRSYDTQRLSVLDDEAIDNPWNARIVAGMAKAAAAAQSVDVWVSPRRPEIALLSRELPLARLWARVFGGIGFAIFTLAGIAGAIGALAALPYYRRMHAAAFMWLFSAFWCGFVFTVNVVLWDEEPREWFALAFVGLFVLIGLLVLASAVSTTLRGDGDLGAADDGPSSTGKATRGLRGNVRRGGLGGHGSDFDKS
ncbi:MAG: DUF3592 domain-containing protein [Burkholderiales bacterium]|nr:DUF3592 domain-containing protein [Burkholderiales bacterium]